MANTQFLLQSNLNSNPLFQQSFHLSPFHSFLIKLPRTHNNNNNNALSMNHSPYKIKTASPKMRMTCFIINHKSEGENGFDGNGEENDNDFTKVATDSNINEVIWRSMENVLKASVLLGLLFVFDDGRLALAATGGRMGGSSFSSSGSSSSQSSSSTSSSSGSYSSPPSSSSSYSSPDSSSSRSYSIPSSSSSTSYSIPDSSSSSSYSTWDSSPESSSESYSTQISSPVRPNSANEPGSNDLLIFITFCAVVYVGYYLLKHYDGKHVVKTSVLMLQVGLLGSAKSLQRDLNRIAEVADTSTPKGLSYILQEVTLALLRHPDYCISGYSSVDVKRSEFECENRFNNLSIEERGKFNEETLVNVNNIKKQSATSQGSNGVWNEYIVVKIIVAATSMLELPPIKSSAQLKEALQKLASISSSNILAAEVLWTPQEENDSLTEQKMLQDYPRLHPL